MKTKIQELTQQTQNEVQDKTQLIQLLKTYKIPKIKLKVIHRTKGSSQLPSYLVILWLRKLKAGECQVVLTKLW